MFRFSTENLPRDSKVIEKLGLICKFLKHLLFDAQRLFLYLSSFFLYSFTFLPNSILHTWLVLQTPPAKVKAKHSFQT